jgi:hypothetical protein
LFNLFKFALLRESKNQLLFESVLLYLSAQLKKLTSDDIVFLYDLLSKSKPNPHFKCLGETSVILVKGLVNQYLPSIIQAIGRMEISHPHQLMSILRYYVETSIQSKSSIPSTYLEILSLQLIRMSAKLTEEQFVTCFGWFAELDLKSSAFADHFNKTFETIVDLDVAWTPKVYVLGGNVSTQIPSNEFSRAENSSTKDATSLLVEEKFMSTLNYVWSFFKFSFRSGNTKHIDISLLKKMIKVLNGMVRYCFYSDIIPPQVFWNQA